MLPVLVLLLGIGVGTVAAVTAQLRCIDAAREGARAAARGETVGTATELAAQAAPEGAEVTVSVGEERVVVTVTARVEIGGGVLPTVLVMGEAVAVPEPTAAAGPAP